VSAALDNRVLQENRCRGFKSSAYALDFRRVFPAPMVDCTDDRPQIGTDRAKRIELLSSVCAALINREDLPISELMEPP
jgi:hypothetical protein